MNARTLQEVRDSFLFTHLHADLIDGSVRILRRMQETIQHQDLEDIHRCIQRFTYRFYSCEQDFLCAWGIEPELEEHGRHQANPAAYRLAASHLCIVNSLILSRCT